MGYQKQPLNFRGTRQLSRTTNSCQELGSRVTTWNDNATFRFRYLEWRAAFPSSACELVAQHRSRRNAWQSWLPNRKRTEGGGGGGVFVPHRKAFSRSGCRERPRLLSLRVLWRAQSCELRGSVLRGKLWRDELGWWLPLFFSSCQKPEDVCSDASVSKTKSKTRVLIKQERRKQKEYFERNKLKSKMKLLGVFSPVKNPTVSLDLLNLYMVNQISSKKETPESMKRPTHVNMNRDLKIPLRKHDLELPMTPHCVPSKLCIDDMENNVPYQRLCSKEETGPVQSSQDMNSHRMFHKAENYSYPPPSFPAELPSNRHILNQNSTSRIAPSPWKSAYEANHSEQFNNGKFSDSVFSQFNKHQNVFSSSQKTEEFGASYERIHSLETGDFLTKRSVAMGEDPRSLYERRQPDFAMEKTSVQHVWGNQGKEFSNCLEDVIHSTQRHLPDNPNSFVSHSMIDLLSRDQPGRRAAFYKCGYGSMSDPHVASADESDSTGGFIKGNFTVPQAAFHYLPFNTNYIETCQSNKPYRKEYKNNEINEFRRTSEKGCYPTSSARKGWCCTFSFSLYKYLESSQSSQSASYSPRPTDSTFSSSSDLISEDEDQIQKQIEDSNKKATETTHNCLEKMEDQLGDITVKDSAKTHIQNDNFHQSSEKNSADTFPESQCSSEHTSQKKLNGSCALQAGRCDSGVQTEREPVVAATADVAIQCTIIISQCSCKGGPSGHLKEASSIQEAGSYREDMTADTTGGQETQTTHCKISD
ncbi:uncharacterized protein C12orf40 homolog [Acomys russatus]|uniref:uncharacterized protein C12orf40 homolog n=1 Tax=Acomys russatus TaxID=60746 RepID=UPI0021E27023|nr:uncharacterized protein C12orf40 homolog [Acomys russatus]